MMRKPTGLAGAAVALAAVAFPGAAGAEVIEPQPWQVNLQPAATPIMEMIHHFSNGMFVVIGAIAIFVLVLLLYVMFRFNVRSNPVPHAPATTR
jgi:cytochrome c oxidase subunit 2